MQAAEDGDGNEGPGQAGDLAARRGEAAVAWAAQIGSERALVHSD